MVVERGKKMGQKLNLSLSLRFPEYGWVSANCHVFCSQPTLVKEAQ